MTAHNWARDVGNSLRLWPGRSPLSLIIRGVIHGVIAAIIFYFSWQIRAGEVLEASATERETITTIATVALVVGVVMLLLAVARIAVGIIDGISSRTIEGRVMDFRDRKLGDQLPYLVQNAIFRRNEHRYDRRRIWVEVLLDTADGVKSVTIRNRSRARDLIVGSRVRMTVTPITGYTSNIQQL